MRLDDDWNPQSDASWRIKAAGMGALRVALLFGSGAIALALIVVPLADRERVAVVRPALDTIQTGSIGTNSYTVRRSVLQPSPRSVCILHGDGQRVGDC